MTPYRMNSKSLRRWGVTKEKRAFVYLLRWFMLWVGYRFKSWLPDEVFRKHFRPFMLSRLRFLNHRIEVLMTSSVSIREQGGLRYSIHSRRHGGALRKRVRAAMKERSRYTTEPVSLSEPLYRRLIRRATSGDITFLPEGELHLKNDPQAYLSLLRKSNDSTISRTCSFGHSSTRT